MPGTTILRITITTIGTEKPATIRAGNTTRTENTGISKSGVKQTRRRIGIGATISIDAQEENFAGGVGIVYAQVKGVGGAVPGTRRADRDYSERGL